MLGSWKVGWDFIHRQGLRLIQTLRIPCKY